jgi:asparagine synthase (glutamine-hydrolysing)
MSGICGLFNLDDAPVAENGLAAMTAMLESRSPERSGQWRDGSVGLGHALLATTPELRFERQPFRHAATGCVITADVRLDNREELHEALEPGRPPDAVGDAELILLAYLDRGEPCVEHLLGDFAFALWDPRDRLLFCARDPFGLRPLDYHHVPGKRFVFASDPRAVLVVPQVPRRIDEGRLADFLIPELEMIDYTSTCFEGIQRLPAGHSLSITRDRKQVVEYWRPERAPEPEMRPDDAWAEGFIEAFTRSVEARLRAPVGAVGSMMSGGVDSGSVVAVAKDIAIAEGASMPAIQPTLVCANDLDEYMDTFLGGIDAPFDGDFMILKAAYHAASEHGRRVVLDGAGGDIVLNEGGYILGLLRGGRLLQALGEIRGENAFWGGGVLATLLLSYLRAAYTPSILRSALAGPWNRRRVEALIAESLIDRDFAYGVDLAGRLERLRQTLPAGPLTDSPADRRRAVRPYIVAARERYARLAAATGVEARDPFLDRRVVEYCTALPARLLARDGWSKVLLREQMAGRLPEAVRWARGKPHLGWYFNACVTRRAVERGQLALEDLTAGLAGYVDTGALETAWTTFLGGGDASPVHSAHVLYRWLRDAEHKPVVHGREIG